MIEVFKFEVLNCIFFLTTEKQIIEAPSIGHFDAPKTVEAFS